MNIIIKGCKKISRHSYTMYDFIIEREFFIFQDNVNLNENLNT
jgi:hypothetical protein